MEIVKVRAFMLMLLITVSVITLGQNTALRGIVKDSSGEPLVGVSVVVKGTTNGTTTDVDGKFTLNVNAKPGMILVVSYVGMVNQEQEVKGKHDFSFVLQEDSQVLEDVVVTGFRSISKTNFTGSSTKLQRGGILLRQFHSATKAQIP